MKIGLFFGSYNPIHIGHLIIANHMVEYSDLDEVWLVVTPHNPFKKKKTVGIRVPNNTIALEIVKQLGNPIISTSIRDEDEVLEYTTDPELILEKWGSIVDCVIDAGYGGNEPSTIIDLSESDPVVVREGKGSLDIF